MPKKPLFAIFAVALILLILEGGARIAETALSSKNHPEQIQPGWQAEFFGSLMDWHEPDPELLWRFRANLDNPLIKTNSEHLLGGEIPPRKDPAGYRILLLGDSSPVGLGLKSRREAFGEVLRTMLGLALAGHKNIELINAAVSGYTSEQIACFLKLRGWKYEPDLVILYCGNNDASISGIYSDQELLEGQKLISIRKALSHLALYRILKSFLGAENKADKIAAEKLKVRVSPERFSENLNDIADQCRNHHCPLIILKPPVPYLWPAALQFKPFAYFANREGQVIIPPEMSALLGRNLKYCLSAERFDGIYGRGDIFTRAVYQSAFTDSLPPLESINICRRQLTPAPDDPVALNNLGVAFWENRQYDSADLYLRQARASYVKIHPGTAPALLSGGAPFLFNIGINYLSDSPYALDSHAGSGSIGFQYLDSALQADYFSLRIKKEYWKIIDRFDNPEGGLGPDNVTVIDLPTLFAKNGGEKLFIDHCHPTAEGHRLIAKALFDILPGYQYHLNPGATIPL